MGPAAMGMQVQSGFHDHDFEVPRLPPGLSGGNAFVPSDFAWYVFAGADGQAVARDATLDGNSFIASPRSGAPRSSANSTPVSR